MAEDIHKSQVEYNDDDIICDTLAYPDQRSLVFHLLYAMDAFDYEVSLEAIADNFARGFGVIISTQSEVFNQAASIINQRKELDHIIQPLLANWRFERLGAVTRLIIRQAIWELINTRIDPILIINQAVELAKCFAEKDAYKFINGVLDEYIKKVRE